MTTLIDSHIRSFVRRASRMTRAQENSLKNLWPTCGLNVEEGILNIPKIFGRDASLILEIGFGMGHSLLQQAQENPDKNFIGIEVYPPGVGSLLHQMEKLNLKNIRVFQADAIEVLANCIPAHSLDCLQIFFPDPWPKRRHHKRRLIQPHFLELIQPKFKSQGVLHLATDWQEYAEHMLAVLSAHAAFQNLSPDQKFFPRSEDRAVTKFEKRGERLGHGVWELKFNVVI